VPPLRVTDLCIEYALIASEAVRNGLAGVVGDPLGLYAHAEQESTEQVQTRVDTSAFHFSEQAVDLE
jgi:hypothetical protein